MKEIVLANNKGIALVDDEDYGLVSKYSWYISIRDGNACAIGSNGRNTLVKMHRLILGIRDPKIKIDHIDGNGLNNQRSNLRIATVSQNGANQRKMSGHTSKYKGVCLHRGKWQASIGYNNKYIYLGMFNVEEEAALAYNEKAKEIFGEFAKLNVIM